MNAEHSSMNESYVAHVHRRRYSNRMNSLCTHPRCRCSLNVRRILGMILWYLCTLCFFLSSSSSQMPPSAREVDKSLTFRWIHPTTDPQLWKAVQSAFRDELKPDPAGPGQDTLDVYRDKYVARVGIINRSALVFIGHRPTKKLTKEQEWDQYYSAFNFDTDTHQKAEIEHAETLWKLQF